MLKRFKIPALALAAAMAFAAPNLTLAADRDDHRGRDVDRHEVDRHHQDRRDSRDRYRDHDRDHDRDGRRSYDR